MNTAFTTPPAPKEHSEEVKAILAKTEAAITGQAVVETTTTQPNN